MLLHQIYTLFQCLSPIFSFKIDLPPEPESVFHVGYTLNTEDIHLLEGSLWISRYIKCRSLSESREEVDEHFFV